MTDLERLKAAYYDACSAYNAVLAAQDKEQDA